MGLVKRVGVMEAVTVSPVYVKSILKGAVKQGYNAEEILRVQGLPSQILSNARLRISTLAFASLTRALTGLLRDESVGLLAAATPIGSFALMARACLSCSDMRESLQIWRDAINWLPASTSACTQFDADGGLIAFDCQKAAGIGDNYVIESQLTSCHRFHCWLANEFLPIERVDLTCPEPAFSAEHRFVFYGAPVHYAQKRNALHFNSKSLEQGNFRTRDELRDLLDKPLAHIMTQPRQGNTVAVKIRLWMERLFREGDGLPVLEEASAYLGLTQQTLRRRLRQEGYTFIQLKADTRRDVAIYYIKQSDLSVEEIAMKLGFSDASTFIRSFKKWAGVTPLVYRKL